MLRFGRWVQAGGEAVEVEGPGAERVETFDVMVVGETGLDLTGVRRIPANPGVAFMGDNKGGPFGTPGDLAWEWLCPAANPDGWPNSDFLKPWFNGMDLTRRPAGKWIVDFGWKMTEEEAALYEVPFGHVRDHVHPAAGEPAESVSFQLVAACLA